ncbi:LuxR family transcriptional regulator [Mycobacterium sp. 236(2023)]|uniref:LuxR C-terminal-related transcriptional regulator n=1 Tax=Mycobacterium sp. 236(2023) TaxID=3038163 RepID=UPI0024154ADD|nr:LuxR family transcriptional regulator [Mycobacterium sp. 236(2023)]MDG4663440.1 LuxR C-terminal-related transcriptional regulator [Mycobacterium sp. 236(2023)]
MATSMVGRAGETRAIATLLDTVERASAGLLLDGEPGIGKTTTWLYARDIAAERGFTVLSARVSQAESVFAYASLCDLLTDIPDLDADLPEPQREAISQVMSRTHRGGTTDLYAVGAATLSILERCAGSAPVLLAFDDLQWMDSSSRTAIAFAVRRMRWRLAVLGTTRTGTPDSRSTSWLQLFDPTMLTRRTLNPLTPPELQSAIESALGVRLSAPEVGRIAQVSGGNPYYAVELARARGRRGELALSQSLSDIVRARLDILDADVKDALLIAAASTTPTVELIAAASNTDTTRVVRLIDAAAAGGIARLSNGIVAFAHPLLAVGVYEQAPDALRRDIHRRLASLVSESESQARHLALATAVDDPSVVAALDAAALAAVMRGAPPAAAELLELAIQHGGDTPQRRIQLAGIQFSLGDMARARDALHDVLATLPAGPLRGHAVSLLGSIRMLDDSMIAAVPLFEEAYELGRDDVALRVNAATSAAYALYNSGDYLSSAEMASHAADDAEVLGDPSLISSAVGMSVLLNFGVGHGIDEQGLQRSIDLMDRNARTPIPLRATMHRAQLLSWTGHLEEAQASYDLIRLECADRGHEADIQHVTLQKFIAQLWIGDYPAAESSLQDMAMRARLLDGELAQIAATAMRSALASVRGEVNVARDTAKEVTAAAERRGMQSIDDGVAGFLAAMEISLGNHQRALEAAGPSLFGGRIKPLGTELVTSLCLPDGIEALIVLDRLEEATPFIELLETNGQRNDRPWMLAVGARCRAMWHAGRGDLDRALGVAEMSLRHHARVPMPLERARTQLLTGQLLRRNRRREAAEQMFGEALATFERLGAPLWVNRARLELDRMAGSRDSLNLTPSESRVAELAADGLSNKAIATELFVSHKTVDNHLGRVYRKLGVRSRAELARKMPHPGAPTHESDHR